MNKIVIAAFALGMTSLSSVALAERATEYIIESGWTKTEAREKAIKVAKQRYNHYTIKSISFGECIYHQPYENQPVDCKLQVYVERHKQ